MTLKSSYSYILLLLSISGSAPSTRKVQRTNGWYFVDDLEKFDLVSYLSKQRRWSIDTFGHGPRLLGIIKHIQKELVELAAADTSNNLLEEWCDIIILGLDGAWRSGSTPAEVCKQLSRKLEINRNRKWPIAGSQDQAIEHIRSDKEVKGQGRK